MLRSSDDQGLGLDNGEPSTSHLMAVDRIATILQPPTASSKDPDLEMSESKDESESESGSDEEDNKMSDYEGSDEPNDLMILDQYQTRIQKENLVI